DLGALGHWPGRLSARSASSGFRRMERSIPRWAAALLARRCRPTSGLRRAACRIERSVRPAGAAPLGLGQLRRVARRIYFGRHGELRRTAQRDQWREQPGWPQRELLGQLGCGRPDPGSANPGYSRTCPARYAGDDILCPWNADVAGRRRIRALATRQQQRLLPGQRSVLARLEASGLARRAGARGIRCAAAGATPRTSGAALPP